jgi:hypothetical protein
VKTRRTTMRSDDTTITIMTANMATTTMSIRCRTPWS